MHTLTPEQIVENFEKFQSFIEKIKNEDQKIAIKKLLECIEERLSLCPASAKLDQHNCFPGGLVDHSMRVLANALKVKKTFFEEYNISNDSLIITCLFHDLGKIGDLNQDYYLDQDSEWHRNKLGEIYKRNPNCQYMTVPHRSLWWLQYFNVRLSQDEMLAIMLHDGLYDEGNKKYSMKETPLCDVIHIADYISCKQEKEQNGKSSS